MSEPLVVLDVDLATRLVAAIRAIRAVADEDEVSVDAYSMGCAACEAIVGRELGHDVHSLAMQLLSLGAGR